MLRLDVSHDCLVWSLRLLLCAFWIQILRIISSLPAHPKTIFEAKCLFRRSDRNFWPAELVAIRTLILMLLLLKELYFEFSVACYYRLYTELVCGATRTLLLLL